LHFVSCSNISLRFIDIICSRDFLRSSNWEKSKIREKSEKGRVSSEG